MRIDDTGFAGQVFFILEEGDLEVLPPLVGDSKSVAFDVLIGL